ncbi:hypothetical protein TUM17387_26220 [Shewanella carassii]|nr:hypothetical protein TUM17387_26220 [Shewanella carassii]
MLMAIVTVHLDNGLFMSNNGYEFGLALLAATVSVAIYRLELTAAKQTNFKLAKGRNLYAQVVEGELQLAGDTLQSGDGIHINEREEFAIKAGNKRIVALVFNLP